MVTACLLVNNNYNWGRNPNLQMFKKAVKMTEDQCAEYMQLMQNADRDIVRNVGWGFYPNTCFIIKFLYEL